MELTPREKDKLLIFTAGLLAESELVTDDDVWLKAPSVRGSSPA